MGIPEEDKGPRWLQDYKSLDVDGKTSAGGNGSAGDAGGTGVRANLPAMRDFGSALEQNLREDYAPHANKVFDEMAVPAEATANFAELQSVLSRHAELKALATDNIANHGNGALVFAKAIEDISKRYQQADAFASARIADIQKYLGTSPDGPATSPTITNSQGDA